MIQQKENFHLKNWELVSINPNNRNWTWINYFNFWAVSTQTIIGFSIIASLYILYDLNSIAVLTGCLIAGFLVYLLANLIGKTSQSSGLSFPVILRLSMGFNGARYVGMLRGLVGIFMFGVQTFFISKSIGYLIRIFIYEIDIEVLNNEIFLFFFFGMNLIDWVSLIITFLIQFYLFTSGQIRNRKFISFSAIFVYIGLVVFLITIVSENYNELINSLKISTNTKNFISKENIIPIITIAGTMFAYFSILLVNYGDFSRYAKNYKEMNKGNLSLILNLIIFSFFALLISLGSDIILTKKGISVDQLLTNPNDIIGKINNNILTATSLLFIIVSSISSNLIANYIPSQNTLINFLPNTLNIKKCGFLILVLGLVVSIFWLSILSKNAILVTVDTITAFYGPIFGILIADFYFVKKQKINHKELFYPTETTEYIYSNGWNYKAIYSLIIGFIFSASTIWNESLLSLQSYSWIIGAFVSYVIYYLLNNE